MELINAQNIQKEYENFFLDNFSISLESGKLFGILGPNGSGKSTIIKILSGQITAKNGIINVLGTNPLKNPIETKEKIGIIPEQETPPAFLTVNEYLEFIANIRKIKNPHEEIFHWLKFFEMETEKNQIIKNLSRGTKQKILFIQAFIHKPKLVFIDEPLINLDPIIQKKMKKFLRDYVAKSNTIILSTHILSVAEEICDDICILKNGKILYSGNLEEIKKNNSNLEDYFIEITKK